MGTNQKKSCVKIIDYKDDITVQAQILILKFRGFIIKYGLEEIKQKNVYKTSYFSLYYKDPNRLPKKYFWGLITKKPKEVFLGYFDFEHSLKEGSDKKIWQLNLESRRYFNRVKEICKKLNTQFNKDISIFIENGK